MELSEFLKRYSNISNKFIDDINNKNIHIINLDKVSKWLKTRKSI